MSSKLKFNKWGCKKDRGKKKFTNPFGNYTAPYKRTWYQHDIDQIIYSTASRKMQRKSQLLPSSDPRCRTRSSHVQEVVRIAREISEGLGLDTALTEAIAYGHDLGNSAYGKIGNDELSKLSEPNNFKHEEASKLMALTLSAHKIEKEGREEEFGYTKAVNLLNNNITLWKWPNSDFQLRIGKLNDCYFEYVITPEVLNGIEYHNHGSPDTLEGQVVQIADEFSYIIQDIDDLIKTELINGDNYAALQHEESFTYDGNTMNWKDINNFYPSIKLNDIFHTTRGRRVSTLISRFIKYNLNCLNQVKIIKWYRSEIKQENIPKLEVDDGLKFLVNYIKNEIIKPHYKNTYILSSSKIQIAEINTLFDILSNSNLIEDNKSLNEFMNSLNSTPFKGFSKEWKKCYLIANLSYYEIKIIFDRYFQRDMKFALDLKEGIDNIL